MKESKVRTARSKRDRCKEQNIGGDDDGDCDCDLPKLICLRLRLPVVLSLAK